MRIAEFSVPLPKLALQPRSGEVDVLEDAHRLADVGHVGIGSQTLGADGHDLPRLNLAHELGAHGHEGARLGGDYPTCRMRNAECGLRSFQFLCRNWLSSRDRAK